MHVRESRNFKENFFNIAAQKGWFAHGLDHYGLCVVLPSSELPALDTLHADPTGWVLKHRDPSLTFQGPSDTTNLVNVRLNVNTTGKVGYDLITIGTAVSILGAWLAGIIGLNCTWRLVQGNKPNGQSELKAE